MSEMKLLIAAQATQTASEDQLYEETYPRLNRFLQYGATTIKAKSGYGLTSTTN